MQGDKKQEDKKRICKEQRGCNSNWFNRLANGTIQIIGSLIFLILVWYSVRYTQYAQYNGSEKLLVKRDSIAVNLLFGFLFFLVTGPVVWQNVRNIKRNKKDQKQVFCQWADRKKIIFFISLLWLGICTVWWISSGDRPPHEDPKEICDGVNAILSGDYSYFRPGGYFQMYPQQLGLAAVVELLFLVFGQGNYLIYQIICGVMALGIFTMGYAIVGRISEQEDALWSAQILYCIMMCGCFPLLFYTTWVYGEIPFLFFSFLAFLLLLTYRKDKKISRLLLMAVSSTAAVVVRGNAWIAVIAFCLVLLVHFFVQTGKKDLRLLGIVLLLILLPLACNKVITEVYHTHAEQFLDEEITSKGMPAAAWAAMGMQEGPWACGWYNQYGVSLYWEKEFDTDRVKEAAWLEIGNRMDYFRANPGYAVSFYKEKVLTQWNDPLYQSLFFNTDFGDQEPEEGTLIYDICYGKNGDRLLWVCDRLQFLVYMGILLYYLLCIPRDGSTLCHAFGAALIGCFFFSILWEGKARYIFPAYVMMFPLAAMGWNRLLFRCMQFAPIPHLTGLRFGGGITEK